MFTNNASTDATRKHFFAGDGFTKNKEVVSKLIDSTTKKIEKTNLPYFIVSTEQQVGNTFGQRLSNAISNVFNNGYNNVIVLGNDCPQITSGHILEANSLFNDHQLIIGPTIKGGSYLIGVTKTSFHKESFETLRWETSFLFKDLKEYSAFNSNHYFISSYQTDLNNSDDLKRYVATFIYSSNLAKSLLLLYKKFNNCVKKYHSFYSQNPIPFFFSTKAPPVA